MVFPSLLFRFDSFITVTLWHFHCYNVNCWFAGFRYTVFKDGCTPAGSNGPKTSSYTVGAASNWGQAYIPGIWHYFQMYLSSQLLKLSSCHAGFDEDLHAPSQTERHTRNPLSGCCSRPVCVCFSANALSGILYHNLCWSARDSTKICMPSLRTSSRHLTTNRMPTP